MLTTYKKLFLKLKSENITYFIYKGLNHLKEDLSGKRGDIDILVSPSSLDSFRKIVKELGFNRIKRPTTFPIHYISRDEGTGLFMMLDVDTSIKLGYGAIHSVRLNPDIDKVSLVALDIEGIQINILDLPDYLYLTFMIRVTSKNPTNDHLVELKKVYNQLNKKKEQLSYFGDLLGEDFLNLSINECKTWESLRRTYKNKVLDIFIDKSTKEKLKRTHLHITIIVKTIIRKIKRVLGRPPSLAHKGYIIAFVGVDGSGKSSAIEAILNDDYYRYSGLKRIYFGGNEFLLPGIQKLYHWLASTKNIKGLRVIPSVIMQLDRRLRIIKALYFKYMGNIVLCDRYYYDDELSRKRIRRKIKDGKGSVVLNYIQLITRPKVSIEPDLTFYLDVSPDVAYSRKQDFSYDKMLEVNSNYRELMSKREEVTFVDADQEQKAVQFFIFKKIKNCTAEQ